MYGSVSGVCMSAMTSAGAAELRLEVFAQLFDCRRELLPTPRARPDEPISASQQEPVVGRPPRIVVRTFGVPHHEFREAKFTTASSADRFGPEESLRGQDRRSDHVRQRRLGPVEHPV